MRIAVIIFIVFGGAALYLYLKQNAEKNNKRFISGEIINRLIANNQFDYRNTDTEKELDRKIADSVKESVA